MHFSLPIPSLFLSLPCLYTLTLAAPWPPGPPHTGPPPSTPTFYKGHDLSSLRLFEPGHSAPLSVVFKDTQRGNITRPADEILASGGR
jgi:hypothetical protein